MVYKGVIFIHFPCMKMAAGLHQIIIPKALLVLAEHTLTSAACGSAVVWCLDTASRCVIPGIASLMWSTFWFHVFTVSIRLYPPSESPSFYDHLSGCVGFYPYIFFVGFHHNMPQNMPPHELHGRFSSHEADDTGGYIPWWLYIDIPLLIYITIAISIGISHISIGISHYIYI